MPTLGKPSNPKWNKKNKAHERRRVDNSKFYNSTVWRKLSTSYRYENPLCEICLALDRVVPANSTDHVIPISFGGARLDRANLMALCDNMAGTCHPIKSALEKKGQPLIEYKYNSDNDKVPIDRADIVAVIVEKKNKK